jgi:CheY-like chemotaxis protein
MADKLKILITDDSKLLRKKLRAELEQLGCEVIEAENGKEAIMKDLQEQPDGVILDIVMPEVGGIEALQVIKEVNPDIPIIMKKRQKISEMFCPFCFTSIVLL